MADDSDDILDKYYGDGPTTSDVIAKMPVESTPTMLGPRTWFDVMRDQAMRGERQFSPETNAALERKPEQTFGWFGNLMNSIPEPISNAMAFGVGMMPGRAPRVGAKPPRADVYQPSMHDPNVRELQGPGFYSHMLAELKDMERGGRRIGDAPAWMKELQRAQVKPEEIAGSGIDQYMRQQDALREYGPMTRWELENYAREHQPMIEEARFGGDNGWIDTRQITGDRLPPGNFPKDVQGPLKWGGQYGGQKLVLDDNPTNREFVLGLQPSKRAQELQAQISDIHKRQYEIGTDVAAKQLDALSKQLHIENQGRYVEPHFHEVGDYLGHGRGGEYKLSTGEPAWLADEIQNTRAQKIRDAGGRDPSTDALMQKRVDEAAAARDALYAEAEARMRELARQRVGPEGDKTLDAILANAGSVKPYRVREAIAMMEPGWRERLDAADNAHRLATAEQQAKLQAAPGHPLVNDMSVANRLGLRHQLLQTKGKDVAGLTLTPGDLQNERYGLSKFVDYLHFAPDSGEPNFNSSQPYRQRFGTLYAGKHAYPPEITRPVETREQLEDFLGKDVASALLSKPLTTAGGTYRGTLQSTPMHRIDHLAGHEIGGQGMRDYYDRQYPDTLNKELKRLDPNYPGQREADLVYEGKDLNGEGIGEYLPYEGGPFHHFPFTDRIRRQIELGLPFYKAGGRIGYEEGGDTRIGEGYTAPETLRPLPRPFDPYWLPPDEPKRAELRDADRERPDAPLDRTQRDMVGPWNALPAAFELGHKAHEVYDMAHAGEWMPAAREFAQTTLPMVAGAVVPMAPKGRPRMGIEEYVQNLKNRPTSQHDVVNFDKILDTDQGVPASISRLGTSEPHYRQDKRNLQLRQNQPQALQDATSRTSINNMVKLADEGLYTGLDGRPINPWYHPGALYDTFIRELGDELGADRFQKFMGFLASTSPMTGVERNTIEALHGLHNYINDIPMSKLDTSHLTGGAYNNKVNMLGDVASGEGLTSAGGPKVRNFWLNLMGAGYMPEYEFANGRAKLIQPPSTLDNIMSQAFGYVDAEGKPKRPVGPPYRVMQDVLHRIAQKFDATDPDTQAAIWQAFQRAKDREKGPFASSGTAYNMPFAGTFNEIINRIGREREQHPSQVLENLLTGREAPPNFFTVKKDGGAAMKDGGWETEVSPVSEEPPIFWRHPDVQLEDRPLRYPLTSGGDGDPWGLSQGVDRGWMNSYVTPPDYMEKPPQDALGGGELDMSTGDHAWRPMVRGWTSADRESHNVEDRNQRRRLMDWLDQARMMFSEPGHGLYASGGDVRLDKPDDVTTSDTIAAMPYEGAGNSLALRAWMRDRGLHGEKFSDAANQAMAPYPPQTFNWFGNMMNAIPPEIGLAAMFLGPSGASRVGRTTGWGSPQALTEAQQRWGREPLSKTWQETGWAPHDTFGVDPAAYYKGEPMTWYPSKNLSIKEDQLKRWVRNDVVGARANDKLPNLIELGDLGLAEPSLLNMTADVTLDPGALFGTGSTGRRLIYEGGVKRIGAKPIGEVAPYMNLEGGNLDELRALLPHEMQHAIAAGQRLAPTGDAGQMMKPIRGTLAERMLQEQVADLVRRYDDSVAKRGASNPYSVQLFGELQQARRQLDTAPGYAGYLNGPDERLAREAFIRSRLPEDQQRYLTPGQLDTYAPGVMGERLEATHLVPMKAYEPEGRAMSPSDNPAYDHFRLFRPRFDKGGDVKAQFGLDQRFPADLTGYWQPQYEPSSNGELKALPPRPSDWSQPIAEQLSPTMGAYDTMQLGLDAYHDWQEGKYGDLGYKAPMAAGMFIGLPGSRRAVKAGYFDKEGRGSPAALKAAERAWSRDEDPQAVFNSTGWGPASAWGPHPESPWADQPWTALAAPRFDVAKSARDAIANNGNRGRLKDRMDRLFEGVEPFYDVMGSKSLYKMPTQLTISPGANVDGYVSMQSRWPGISLGDTFSAYQAVKRGDPPSGLTPLRMVIQGPNLDSMRSSGLHEWNHIGQSKFNTPSVYAAPGEEHVPIAGTAAEKYMRSLLGRPEYIPDTQEILGLIPKIRAHAGYLYRPYELASRVREKLGNATQDEIFNGQLPSSMSAYEGIEHNPIVHSSLRDKFGLEGWMFDPTRKDEFKAAGGPVGYGPGGLVRPGEEDSLVEKIGYDAPFSQEAATRSSYSDYDLGNARQPIDPGYDEWRQRALDDRMNEDAAYDATLQAVDAMHPGYKPRNGVGIMNNVEDRRRDGEPEMARDKFLADMLQDRPELSYGDAYGLLPGPGDSGRIGQGMTDPRSLSHKEYTFDPDQIDPVDRMNSWNASHPGLKDIAQSYLPDAPGWLSDAQQMFGAGLRAIDESPVGTYLAANPVFSVKGMPRLVPEGQKGAVIPGEFLKYYRDLIAQYRNNPDIPKSQARSELAAAKKAAFEQYWTNDVLASTIAKELGVTRDIPASLKVSYGADLPGRDPGAIAAKKAEDFWNSKREALNQLWDDPSKVSRAEMAEKLGVSGETLRHHREDLGLPPGKLRQHPDEVAERVADLWNQGKSGSEVAEAMGEGWSRSKVIGLVNRMRKDGRQLRAEGGEVSFDPNQWSEYAEP